MNKTAKIMLIIFIILLFSITIYRVFNIEQIILKYLYPIKYEEMVYKYSEELNIDPMLTFAVIKTESNFDEKAESKRGAVGLMQLMDNTAKEQALKLNMKYSKEMLYDPDINLKLGLNYFNTLLDYHNQNYILAFASYNAGLGNVQKWIQEGTINKDGSNFENIPFKETNLYIRKIIKTYELYRKIYITKEP